MLEKLSFSVLEAEDAESTLELLAGDALPDVVFLDWQLPEMSGIELLDRIRADERTASIPIVMLTAHDKLDDVRTALEAGATDYIMKPFDRGILESKLQTVGVLAPESEAES